MRTFQNLKGFGVPRFCANGRLSMPSAFVDTESTSFRGSEVLGVFSFIDSSVFGEHCPFAGELTLYDPPSSYNLKELSIFLDPTHLK